MADDELWTDDEWRAAMSTKEINDLPDEDFAYIEPGGEKDEEGKTTPRSLRHYPIHDAAHVRNALARAAAAIKGDDEKAADIAKKAMPAIKAAAKKFGIEVSEEDAAPHDHEHRAAAIHPPFDGSHSHAHPANGSQGGDESHTHEHSHSNDSDHGHAHDDQLSKVPAVAIRGELRNVPESRISTGPKFELREVPNGTGGTNLKFTGFASVTEVEYEMEDWLGPWVESVSTGAFKKTLDEGADVAFLLNHQGMTLARTKPGTLKLSEETDGAASPVYGVTGLHSEALLDPQNFYVQAMRSAVERGDLDEMSFAFRVMRQEWNKDWTRRWINEVSLDKGDVSLVNYGANPSTGGTVTMRQKFVSRREPLDLRRAMVRMIELRAGKTISADTMKELQGVLDLIDASDTNVDMALIKLSGLMGVTNPDIEQDEQLPDRQPNPDPDAGDEQEGYSGPFWLSSSIDRARAELEAMKYPPRRSVA